MIRTKSRDYAWNKGWIEFEAPNAQGVYWLRAKDGQTIFVGKGNIRQRLLSHWDHEKPGDLAIWDRNPATFAFELAAHPADLYAQLVGELKPPLPTHPPVVFLLAVKEPATEKPKPADLKTRTTLLMPAGGQRYVGRPKIRRWGHRRYRKAADLKIRATRYLLTNREGLRRR